MNKIGLLKYLLLILAVFVLIGCQDPENPIEETTPSLYLTTDTIVLYAGDERKLEYFVEDIEEYEISIEVEDEEIAKVEGETVYGVTGGETKIKIKIVGYDETEQEVTVRVLGGGPVSTQIMEWVKAEIGYEQLESLILPKNHPTYQSAKITYVSADPEIISDTGIIYPKELDTETYFTIKVEYDNDILISKHNVLVVGMLAKNILNDFKNTVGSFIYRNVDFSNLKTKYSYANITIESSNEDVFTNTGLYTKPDNDENITLSLNVEIPEHNYERTFNVDVTVRGLDILEKAIIVKDNVIKHLNLDASDYRVGGDLDLPETDERFGGKLTWVTNKPEIISYDGKVQLQLLNTYVELFATYTQGGVNTSFTILVETLGKEYSDKWSAIEEFLTQFIFKDEIEVFSYRVTGIGPEYIAQNDGYVQFYTNEGLEVHQDILDPKHKFRPKSPINVQYITIHDTAGNVEGAGVESHSRFIHSEDRAASSWHYTIDDTLLYQHIPLNEVAWHAGDSTGNRTSIGIETCTNPDSDYDVVLLRTAKLVAMLLDEFDLTLYHVRQHRHWSGKNCPQVILANNRWQEVIDLIAVELFGQQNLSDVTFEWESLNKDIMNDQGIVINHPGNETEVSYKVTVTYNGESRVFTHTSLLQAKK